MERAGLTEVLVTGMEIRWMSVSARPMAIGPNPAGRPLRVAPRMIEQESGGQHDLDGQCGPDAVAAG